MKLCPQCEFIYEDDQSLCDMDGHALVNGERLESPLEAVAFDQGAAVSDSSPVALPASLPPAWQSSRFALGAVAAVIFAAVLFVAYYARAHQLQSGASNQAAAREDSEPLASPAFDPVPSASVVERSSPEQSREQSSPSSSESPSLSPSSVASPAQKSVTRARLAYSPVSAGGSPSGNRAPVTIRLTNGASIKADEAWERREGIWYRQAGVVTLLKRSRVRAMDRLAYSPVRPQPAASKPEEKKSKPENLIAQNEPKILTPENSIVRTEPRVVRNENTSVKKESRVSSFLKKTGRILSKPFKF
jgi:hypothetical protein